jgi:hypothetical protein
MFRLPPTSGKLGRSILLAGCALSISSAATANQPLHGALNEANSCRAFASVRADEQAPNGGFQWYAAWYIAYAVCRGS